MATTASLTTSPTTIDSGVSDNVSVTNMGATDVTVSRGPQSFTLRPTQTRVIYPEGAAVTAATVSGVGSVSYTAQAARQSQAVQFAADPAFTGTYAQIGAGGPPRFRPAPKLTILSAMQAGHGWAASSSPPGTFVAADTTDVAIGAQSVSYTTANSDQFAYFFNTLSVDMTGKGLVLWLKLTGTTANLTGLNVDMASSNAFSAYFRASLTLPSTQKTILADGAWHPVYVPWSSFTSVTGSPVRSTIGAVRVNPRSSGTGGATVKFGGLATYADGASVYPNGVVSFTFDDAWATTASVAVPKLSQYGYPATAFPIVERLGTAGNLTLAQLQTLRDTYGWEVGAHCMTNAQHVSVVGQSAASVEAMLLGLRAWQQTNGFPSDSLAWPSGPYDAQALGVAAKYYRYARTNDGVTDSVVTPNKLAANAYVLNSSLTISAAQALVTRAVADGTWVVFVCHDLVNSGGTTNAWTPADFNTLVDFCQSSAIAVDTVSSVMSLR